MRFTVTHSTVYRYTNPASESFAELRLWPRDSGTQTVLRRDLEVDPVVPVDHYVDYFGNNVEFFSVPFRHNSLTVRATADVETRSAPDLSEFLQTPLGEARQLYHSQMLRVFDFLQPTDFVPLASSLKNLRWRRFHDADALGPSLLALNTWIYGRFRYCPGATEVGTPLSLVVRERQGVCQDFAHLMLSILRANGIPARYVSGYIEAGDPAHTNGRAVSAAASHAWVEVFLPGGHWWGLDPTNNQLIGERHVQIAAGRDYNDVAPMRGTYKGAQDQQLKVIVELRRRKARAKA